MTLVSILHILNGDATARILKETELPGHRLSWREALMCGPAPRTDSQKEWLSIRANHLSEAYGRTVPECHERLSHQEACLSSSVEHDEVILWFEFDLFCQINLLYLLNWYADKEFTGTKLALICVDSFPGVDDFYGLGQLNPEQLASLFATRSLITTNVLKLAEKAWNAYTSPDPTVIENVLKKGTSDLPYLKRAFEAHLERFPSVRNGLGKIENCILQLISGGIDEFKPLFATFGELERDYGLGDLQFWNCVRRLSRGRDPLLQIDGLDDGDQVFQHSFAKASFRLTKTGEAVMLGQLDSAAINGLDLWLGGVHLTEGKPLWIWDEEGRGLRRFPVI